MSSFGPGRPFAMPPVVKNIIIINVIIFVISYYFASDFMYRYLALFPLKSTFFEPHQLVTHMFMHAGWGHIFFNMFAVFMFGRILEGVWGSKKMLIFYTVCGLGAATTHLLMNSIQINKMIAMANEFDVAPGYPLFSEIVDKFALKTSYYNQMIKFMQEWFYRAEDPGFIPQAREYVSHIVNTNLHVPTVGASGAVFGLLIAFAMMFPDVELIFIFLPIPIKAKYLIPIYAVIELVFGVSNFKWDQVAHFAHLGGALFGFLLVKYWKRNQFKIY